MSSVCDILRSDRMGLSEEGEAEIRNLEDMMADAGISSEFIEAYAESLIKGFGPSERVQEKALDVLKLVKLDNKIKGFAEELKVHKNKAQFMEDVEGIISASSSFLNKSGGLSMEAIGNAYKDRIDSVRYKMYEDMSDQAKDMFEEMAPEDMGKLFWLVAKKEVQGETPLHELARMLQANYDVHDMLNHQTSVNPDAYKKSLIEDLVNTSKLDTSDSGVRDFMSHLDFSRMFTEFNVHGGPVSATAKPGKFKVDETHKLYPVLKSQVVGKMMAMSSKSNVAEATINNPMIDGHGKGALEKLAVSSHSVNSFISKYGTTNLAQMLTRDSAVSGGQYATRKILGSDGLTGVDAMTQMVHNAVGGDPAIMSTMKSILTKTYNVVQGDAFKGAQTDLGKSIQIIKSLTNSMILGAVPKTQLIGDSQNMAMMIGAFFGGNTAEATMGTWGNILTNAGKFLNFSNQGVDVVSTEGRNAFEGSYMMDRLSNYAQQQSRMLDYDVDSESSAKNFVFRKMGQDLVSWTKGGYYTVTGMNRMDKITADVYVSKAVEGLRGLLTGGPLNGTTKTMFGYYGMDSYSIDILNKVNKMKGGFLSTTLDKLTPAEINSLGIDLEMTYSNNVEGRSHLNLTQEGKDMLVQKYIQELSLNLQVMFKDSLERVQNKPSARDYRMMGGSISKDEAPGQVLHLVSSIKGSVLSSARFGENHLSLQTGQKGNILRQMTNNGGWKEGAMYLTTMIGIGGVNMFMMNALYDLLVGRKPRDLTLDNVLAASMMTGFLGITGDMLFGHFDRANTRSRTLIGPAFGKMDLAMQLFWDKFVRQRDFDISASEYYGVTGLLPSANLPMVQLLRNQIQK